MVVEKALIEKTAARLSKGDKERIAKRVRDAGIRCQSKDVSHFFNGFRTYHTTQKGAAIYDAALCVLEERAAFTKVANSGFEQRLRSLAA